MRKKTQFQVFSSDIFKNTYSVENMWEPAVLTGVPTLHKNLANEMCNTNKQTACRPFLTKFVSF